MTISFVIYLTASVVLTVGLVRTLRRIYDEIVGFDEDNRP